MALNEDLRRENKVKACMIEYRGKNVCIDPSLPLLSLIGKKYTMLILGVIGNKGNRKNFNEIMRDIPFSSTTIISKRLHELQELRLIERNTDGNGVYYSLTDFGRRLRESLLQFFTVVESSFSEEGNGN